MKKRQKMIAIFTAVLFFLTSGFPAFTVKADSLSEEAPVLQDSDNVSISEESSSQETAITTAETITEEETPSLSDEESLQDNTTVTLTEEEASTLFDAESLPETASITEEESSVQSGETATQEMADVTEEIGELTFSVCVEYSPQGYRVIGTLSDFPTGIVHIQPLYSQDDQTYLECGDEWDLRDIKQNYLAETKRLTCLYSNFEPLKSYVEGSLDRFYLKLRLTKENGVIYETQAALIDRGAPQPIPEELTFYANFPSNMRVREMNPFRCYGRYQITVKEAAASNDISAVLPDTLPIEVQLLKKGNPIANVIVDCPVTWKSLSLPSLTAGESVTIEDAAEKIVLPSGTLLRTPMGVFRLDESLDMKQDIVTDEVRLVLNVVSNDEKTTGVLIESNDGLEMAFHYKPTGATSIQAYVISENETEWTELPGLSFLEAINAQPSTANSGYTLVLCNDQEPYHSYLDAIATQNTPTPFFIGVTIKGGVYDGQQLILAWPDNFELPLSLPKLGGAGGNESNAGTDNKGDSTAEGQRPNLPQNTDTEKKEENPNLSENQNMKKQNTESQNAENTMEILTEFDFQNQQTQENDHATDGLDFSAFLRPTIKVHAATIDTEETDAEIVHTENMQTDVHEESTVPETLPTENKLSAALVLSSQDEKTGHQPFFWIIAAAIAGIGITLYIRKTAHK